MPSWTPATPATRTFGSSMTGCWTTYVRPRRKGSCMSRSGTEVAAAAAIGFERLGGDEAGAILDELSALYQEVYAEPPYQWGPEHLSAFQQRFEERRRQPGLTL